MKLSVVTSCHQQGYEKYGRECISTLNQYWPTEVTLYVISEDLLILPPEVYGTRKVHFFNLHQASIKANDFHILYKDNVSVNGRGPKAQSPRHNRHWYTGYNFRLDAYKFSKKVFAIDIAAKHAGSGKLIWLDADTKTFAPVPLELLQRMPPEPYVLAGLTRQQYHTECGFVGYDLDQPLCHEFIKEFVDVYYSGRVFKLKEWHDSWVFDWLRNKMQVPTFSIPHNSASHPFDHSELGQYMRHLKGDLKDPDNPTPKRPRRHRWHMPKRSWR